MPNHSDVVFSIPVAVVDSNININGLSDVRIIGPVTLVYGGGTPSTSSIVSFITLLFSLITVRILFIAVAMFTVSSTSDGIVFDKLNMSGYNPAISISVAYNITVDCDV